MNVKNDVVWLARFWLIDGMILGLPYGEINKLPYGEINKLPCGENHKFI
jgi:hypothetical protein